MEKRLIDQIFDPLFQTAGFSSADVQSLKNIISQIAFARIMRRTMEFIPKAETEELQRRLEKCGSDEEKLKVIEDFSQSSFNLEKVIEDYVDNDLRPFFQRLIAAFLAKASDDQRREMMNLFSG